MIKKSICVFTLYPKQGASSNYRILMYINDLQKDYDVYTYEFWNKKYTEKYINQKKKYALKIFSIYLYGLVKRLYQIFTVASKCDYVIFQKGIFPMLPFTFINYLKRKKCKVIFDVDDAIHIKKRNNSDAIARFANAVVCGNELLSAHYLNINSNTYTFPTVDYTPQYTPYIHDTFDNKTIGWIGSKSSIANLELVIDAINHIKLKYPDINFKFIAGTPDDYDKKIDNAEFVKWSLDNYISEMSSFTIGIMPLYDTEFNRGKCGFKLIQYLNIEKPVIASPVGINDKIIGNCGIIASDTNEWILAIEKLLFDQEFYDNCKVNIKKEFYRKYDYKVILEMWKKLLDEL